MLIAIFLQGTLIMPKNAKNKNRKEIIQQVRDKDPSVRNIATHIPIGFPQKKIKKWKKQGTKIVYLSSLSMFKSREDERATIKDFKAEKHLLKKLKFPSGRIYHRQENEQYSDIIERIKPDILIEDDCESIGGKKNLCFYGLNPNIKKKIKHIVVKEFSGIDHLPDDFYNL